MFVRRKRSGGHEYLQLVHNERVEGRMKQRVIATLGRADQLRESGQLDGLLDSLSRFTEHTAVLSAHRHGELADEAKPRVGPPLVFERLWRDLGLPQIIENLLRGRHFAFSVERALFLTVLHRLIAPGSDRAAEHWQHHYCLGGEPLQRQHLYRAMGWLGEAVPGAGQQDATLPEKAPRCRKDLIEEALFESRRDLFAELSVVFFDTTSMYFEGKGGESLGQHGNSKDHRPDLKQMIVGVVLSGDGTPICSEMWPGNTADVTTLLPVVRRLKRRFGITQVCIVADRGMVSKKTITSLEEHHSDVRYILGARMRSEKRVHQRVLSWPGRYREVYGSRKKSKDPAPLKVKDVRLEDQRYVICYNEEQARTDRETRENIVEHLRAQLSQGDKSLVGNKGYRKYLDASGTGFEIDESKVKEEARFDGKWVLKTNWEAKAEDVALRYKDLWMVEAAFRTAKSILDCRPIFHRRDETIRGHVFCGFLALVLRTELMKRLEAHGWGDVEWARLCEDLDTMRETHLTSGGKRFVIRDDPPGDAGKAIQAAGVALGPKLQTEQLP